MQPRDLLAQSTNTPFDCGLDCSFESRLQRLHFRELLC
jgi:hypothetical protein